MESKTSLPVQFRHADFGPVFVIPKGRDAKAKRLYKFLNWFFRKHRVQYEREVSGRLSDQLLYGGRKG
ncbi:MAG: hypothetical protein V1790_17565 [Planctomycetota bacterium]